MTKLNIEKLIDQTNDTDIKCMLYNIDTYKDMNDYTKYTNNTAEDLKGVQDDGRVLDVTPGTYNGALDTFSYVSNLTVLDIYLALLEEVRQDGFQYLLQDLEEPLTSEARQVRLFTEIFNVFTIGQHLYVDYD